MSDDVAEKKKRVHLTVTAMHAAINDLAFAVHIPKEDAEEYGPCRFVYRTSEGDETTYVCELWADHAGSIEKVIEVKSTAGVEEVTAVLLEHMKGAFESHRAEMLKSMDAVLERHHGALRGARSKIREKKS